MDRKYDLTNQIGQILGIWKILELDKEKSQQKRYYKCQCTHCGAIVSKREDHLCNGFVVYCQRCNFPLYYPNPYETFGTTTKVYSTDKTDYFLCDTDWWESVGKQYCWCKSFERANARDWNAIKNKKHLQLSRFIMQAPKGFVVDHINHDIRDNRKQNLRIATYRENMGNRGKMPYNTNEYKGITAYKTKTQGIRYRARIRYKGKQLNLGTYSTPEEAAKAYNAKAIEVFGEFALLNKIKGE